MEVSKHSTISHTNPKFSGRVGKQEFSGCPGQDSNCEPPEYKPKNEAWFHIIEQMNLLNNCSADNPILIN
jgi:hypothetical protein